MVDLRVDGLLETAECPEVVQLDAFVHAHGDELVMRVIGDHLIIKELHYYCDFLKFPHQKTCYLAI